ncbi:hypothetical protein ACLB2K_048048 [Fragaria x ananassa]
MTFNHKRIQIRFRSNKQNQSEKREHTDLKKEQGEKVRAARSEQQVDAVVMSGGGRWMRILQSVANAWMESGGAALVGFGNCGCEFRDCGLREAVSIDFFLADE